MQADDLQEDIQEQDEVLLRLGDSSTIERTYFLGQHRKTLSGGQDFFTGHEPVALIENDEAAGNRDVASRARLSCHTGQFEKTLPDASADTVSRSWGRVIPLLRWCGNRVPAVSISAVCPRP